MPVKGGTITSTRMATTAVEELPPASAADDRSALVWDNATGLPEWQWVPHVARYSDVLLHNRATAHGVTMYEEMFVAQGNPTTITSPDGFRLLKDGDAITNAASPQTVPRGSIGFVKYLGPGQRTELAYHTPTDLQPLAVDDLASLPDPTTLRGGQHAVVMDDGAGNVTVRVVLGNAGGVGTGYAPIV